jgi:anaerobic magnesium-protoporphyrin IX monomethyl ester cyclase
MKLSLISANPNSEIEIREGNKSIAAFPPLSLLYLASVLKKEGFEVSVLDQPAQSLSFYQTINWIKKENPDILGFSALTSSGRNSALISEKAKENNPNLIVIFGNHHATFNAERILRKYPSVDIIVRGEGEKTIVKLAQCLQNSGDLRDIRGISFRKNEEIISTLDQKLIDNLDLLPFPDRDLIKVDYHCMIAGANIAPKKFTSLISSRGCVYDCRFCSCKKLANKKWRFRTAKNTLDELQLIANKGYKQVIFVDDSFTMNPKRVEEICRGIRKEKMDIEWICEGRVDNCSYDMLRVMAKAGCKVMYFGIESANQRILDYYDKRITPKQSEKTVKKARKAKIDVIIGSFILGAPNETREEMINTIEFSNRIPIDLPQFNILGAHPGNDIWSEFVSRGYIDAEKHWEAGVAVCEVYPEAKVSKEEIMNLMQLGFFKRVYSPTFLLNQAAKTIGSSYRINTILKNIQHVNQIRKTIRQVA